MIWNDALNKIERFITESFTTNLKEQLPIIYVDGPYGIGKSRLVLEIKNKEKDYTCINDVELKNTIPAKIAYVSLAGIENIDQINKDISKSIKKLFTLAWGVLKFFAKIPDFVKNIFYDLGNNNINISTFSYLRMLSKRKRIVIILDELDRKADSLDLNTLFALVTNFAQASKHNVRIIVVGNHEGLISETDKIKALSYRDKICKETINITDNSYNNNLNLINSKDFKKKIFPRFQEGYLNIRVRDKALVSFIDLGAKQLDGKTQLSVFYLLICYYKNLEDNFIHNQVIKIENNLNKKPTFLTNVNLLEEYIFSYISKINYDYKDIINVLVNDRTYSIRDIDKIKILFDHLLNGTKLPTNFTLKHVTMDELSAIEYYCNQLNGINNGLQTQNIIVTDKTVDYYFIFIAHFVQKNVDSNVFQYQFLREFKEIEFSTLYSPTVRNTIRGNCVIQ